MFSSYFFMLQPILYWQNHARLFTQIFFTQYFTSVQFSCSVVSDSLPLHGLQQARLPCNDAIQPSHPLLSSSPTFNFPSIRVFSSESLLHIGWPKCWTFSFSVSHSNEYSELISFRNYRLDLLAVQGNLKNLLQQHTSKASIIQRSGSKSHICTWLLEKP